MLFKSISALGLAAQLAHAIPAPEDTFIDADGSEAKTTVIDAATWKAAHQVLEGRAFTPAPAAPTPELSKRQSDWVWPYGIYSIHCFNGGAWATQKELQIHIAGACQWFRSPEVRARKAGEKRIFRKVSKDIHGRPTTLTYSFTPNQNNDRALDVCQQATYSMVYARKCKGGQDDTQGGKYHLLRRAENGDLTEATYEVDPEHIK